MNRESQSKGHKRKPGAYKPNVPLADLRADLLKAAKGLNSANVKPAPIALGLSGFDPDDINSDDLAPLLKVPKSVAS